MTSPIVLLALGSWEQHGAHLPFDTDTVIIEAVVDDAAAEVAEGGPSEDLDPDLSGPKDGDV